jgi:hypothetical protein
LLHPYEEDLEAELQPFVVAYHSQCILVDQQCLNGIYDLLQGGATIQLANIFTSIKKKEATPEVAIPTTEAQLCAHAQGLCGAAHRGNT